MAKKSPLDEVVEFWGGIPALCKDLGIERTAYYGWHGRIPRLRAFEIEDLSQGDFTVEYLTGQPRYPHLEDS